VKILLGRRRIWRSEEVEEWVKERRKWGGERPKKEVGQRVGELVP
jgi:hypothetical protein